MPDSADDKALEEARGRFLKGMPERVRAMERTLVRLRRSPAERAGQESMLRQIQAFYASAQVFRLESIAASLRETSEWLDLLVEEGRAASQVELDSLSHLCQQLLELGPAGDTKARHNESSHPLVQDPLMRDTEVSGGPKLAASHPRSQRQGRPRITPPMMPIGHAVRRTGSQRAKPPQAELSYPRKRHSAPRLTPGATVTVLVVDAPEVQAQVRAILPVSNFDIKSCSSFQEALRWARSGTPDVLLVDRRFVVAENNLIKHLRGDPLTDFVPVVVTVHASERVDGVQLRRIGANDVVVKPFEGDKLVRALGHLVGALEDEKDGALDLLGDVTCDEIAARVAEEMTRGLTKAVKNGNSLRIPMGDGSEVLAACWAAIARVRTLVTERSGGRVKFEDPSRRSGPTLLSLREGDAEAGEASAKVDLTGKRVVVVDDDPAVVWFFAGVLRAEGAQVDEASRGEDALDLCRQHPVDLLISDILMPGMDGFVLCRELKREPALADIPVILISWKDDFLDRMRELHSGASGYLLKEEGSAQILRKVRQVLAPIAALEARLRAGGEVRGRIEDIGIVSFIRAVARARPDAKVTLRDAWTLFDLNFRKGELVDVNLTGRNGIFSRGAKVLAQLFGCNAGRFSAVGSRAEVRRTLNGSLEDVIAQGTKSLGALLDVVSGTAVMNAYRVVLDPKVVSAFMATSPQPVSHLIERLHGGEGPRFLLLNSDVEPQVLESVLRELARRGGLLQVIGAHGEDQISHSLERRQLRPESPSAHPRSMAEDEEAEPPVQTVPDAPQWTPLSERLEPEERESLRPENEEEAELKAARPLGTIPPALAAAPSVPSEEEDRPLIPMRFSTGLLARLALFMFVFTLGFLGLRHLLHRSEKNEAEVATEGKLPVATEDKLPVATEDKLPFSEKKNANGGATRRATPTQKQPPGVRQVLFGRVIPTVADAGFEVKSGQGVVVLEVDERTDATRIWIDEQPQQGDRLAFALDAGYHEIRLERGDQTSYRFVTIKSGHTHYVPAG